jgi:hypothetical protein
MDDQAKTALESGSTWGVVLFNAGRSTKPIWTFHHYIIILKNGEHGDSFERVGLIHGRHFETPKTYQVLCWSDPSNPPTRYVDGSGDVLDVADVDLHAKPLWLQNAEIRNIKLS